MCARAVAALAPTPPLPPLTTTRCVPPPPPTPAWCPWLAQAIAAVVSGDLPPSFHATCRHLTLSGHRVLALASRTLAAGVTREEVATWSMEQVEADMTFVGLLVLSTPLKVDSVDVIKVVYGGMVVCGVW